MYKIKRPPGQNFFSVQNLSCFKIPISCSIFMYLDNFIVFLFVLITSEMILDHFFEVLDKSRIQDDAPRWPPFRNVTSCDVITP